MKVGSGDSGMLEQVSSARLNDPAALAEASILARRYMSHFSSKDVQEISGECSANVEAVFNSQSRMLFYLIQSEARRSIWNLWLYKHEEILVSNNASVFNHLLTTKTRSLLQEAYDKIPRGFAAACRRMRACTMSDYDLLHRVLSADDGAISRELGQKNISIDRKALEFIDKSPLSISYTVALLLSRYDKLEELSCLAKACSPTQAKSLQLLLKKSAYGSYEELTSEMQKWREKLVFPGVPIIPAADSDFKMVHTEASLKMAGRKWRNCLRTSYIRGVYGQKLHKGTQQIYIFKNSLLVRISLSHNECWCLGEIDVGNHADLVPELKNRLLSYGVKLQEPYTVADAIAALAETDSLSDWDL